MNIYKKKRQKTNLSQSDVAHMLGIDCKRYKLIEGGKVKMPFNLIDKFNEVMSKGVVNDVEMHEREREINEWFEKFCTKGEDGKRLLDDKLKEFNIANYEELAGLLGYRSSSTISYAFKNMDKAGHDFKGRLYDFFNNELNIQDPDKKVEEPKKVETKPIIKTNNLAGLQFKLTLEYNKRIEELNCDIRDYKERIEEHEKEIARLNSYIDTKYALKDMCEEFVKSINEEN